MLTSTRPTVLYGEGALFHATEGTSEKRLHGTQISMQSFLPEIYWPAKEENDKYH